MARLSQGKHRRPSSRELNTRSRARRVMARINIPFLVIAALLLMLGLLIVQSAVAGLASYSFLRQVIGVLVGLVLMVLIAFFDYRKLAPYTLPLLIATAFLILLPWVPGLGVTVNGARNWIMIFGQQIQPSEFAKPLLILYMASLVAKYSGNLNEGKEYFKALGFLLIPTALMVAQPDLGTGMVFFVAGMVILFAGGANRKWLIITLAVLIACVIALIAADGLLDNMLGSDVLIKDYQKNRILVFLNEDVDPTGAGYNLKQAKIAIGSGGLTGKGFGNATQSTLGFLPEAPTDFIFCVLAEQFGFMGSLGLLLLYVLLLINALRIAFTANNSFGTLVVAGVMGMWVFQIFENIGMSCGLMPIMGIPLPFMSYGSSFMMVNFIALGLLCSVWAHREQK